MRWLLDAFGTLELENTRSIVARIGIKKRSRGAHCISRNTVAMGTVFAVKSVFAPHNVAAHRSGTERQFLKIKTCFSQHHRIVGSPKHCQKNCCNLLFLRLSEPLLGRLNHV